MKPPAPTAPAAPTSSAAAGPAAAEHAPAAPQSRPRAAAGDPLEAILPPPKPPRTLTPAAAIAPVELPNMRAESHAGGARGKIGRWWDRVREANRQPRPPRYTVAEVWDGVAEHWASPMNWIYALLVMVAIAYFIYQGSQHWVAVIDDSYITFRFADLFANGQGLRFNVDGDRVEGFTNFLWMVPLALVIRLGGDVMLWSKLFGMGYAIGIIITSYQFSRYLRGRNDIFNLFPPVFLAANSYFSHWALMGLETQGAVFFVFFAYYRFYREMSDQRMWLISPLMASAAAMMRIDSLYYLSPLGAYGVVLILQGHLPIRRLAAWGMIAAMTFGFYFWSRWLYFGDVYPNTYYAKQRLVSDSRVRGLEHLKQFYLNANGGKDTWKPIPISSLNKSDPNYTRLAVERTAWLLQVAWKNAFWWINWWALSAGLLLLYPRLKNYLLILTPLAMNVYYVYHVDGDWMPAFRFLQITLPFWAMAGALGISVIQDATARWKFAPRSLLRLPVYAYLSFALLGLSLEQARIATVYVFGKDPIWVNRPQDWWKWSNVKKSYLGGFSPPLRETADWLLLNTVDGGKVFMSDIGQPLWFASHLSLYDYDGLTDKYFADAPSVRKGLKPLKDHIEEIKREMKLDHPTKLQEKKILEDARARYKTALDTRNADYIHLREKPEYLILFMTLANPNDPMGQGWAYPQSAAVYEHPAFRENYEFAFKNAKIGTVWNTVYRRKGVPQTIPDSVKADRLIRTIKRNPRLYYLVPLAYQTMGQLTDPKEKDKLRQVVMNRLADIKYNTYAVNDLTMFANQQKDMDIIEKLMDLSGKASPNDPDMLRTKADLAWNQGDKQKAIAFLRRAADAVGPENNAHLFQLAYYYEASGQPRKSVEASEEAALRTPDQPRPWMDVMGYAMRHAWDPGRPAEERIWFLEKAELGMNRLNSLTPDEGRKADLERVETELTRLRAIAAAGAELGKAQPAADAAGTTPTAALSGSDGPTTPTQSNGAVPPETSSPQTPHAP